MGKKHLKPETDGSTATLETPADAGVATIRRPDDDGSVQASALPSAPLDMPEMIRIDVAALKPSPSNPRKHFDEAKLRELGEDLRVKGQISPIVARHSPDLEYYEIVVGECRWRAAKLAGLPSLLAIVRELDDVQVLKLQLSENAKRNDITPLEEAAAFAQLRTMENLTAEQLAEQVGVSVRQVYARLALLDLPKALRDALEREEITTAHAEIIARLPQTLHLEALEMATMVQWADGEDKRFPIPIRTFETAVRKDLLRELSAAPWDLHDATLHKKNGACAECPLRSLASSPLLADQQNDCCLDADCWASKTNAHLQRRIDELREQGELVLLAQDLHDAKQAGFKDAVESDLFKETKESNKNALRAIWVNGPKAGQETQVVPNKKEIEQRREYDPGARAVASEYLAPEGAKASAAAADDKPKKSLKEREAELEKRRSGAVTDRLREKLLPKFSAEQFIALHGELWLFHLNALAAAFGVQGQDARYGDGWKQFGKLCEKSGTKPAAFEPLAQKLWLGVRPHLEASLQFATLSSLPLDKAKACAALIGEDWEALYAQAVKDLPEPKGWAAERGESSTPAKADKTEKADSISGTEIAKRVRNANKTKAKPKAKKRK